MTEIESARYEYSPEERPAIPGSPGSPARSARARVVNALVAVALAVSATFGNALVNVNATALGGALGLYSTQVSWLPAVYVATLASANLVLVKSRAQWGIPAVTHVVLWTYLTAGLWQLAFPGFAAAIAMHAANGFAAGAVITLAIYHLMQVFPGKLRPIALVAGMGLVQMGVPLARLVPVEMLALDQWRGLCLIECAVALGLLALTTLVPLPRSEHSRSFEPLDFVTVALLLPAYLLFSGVLAQGRLQWWTDAPWMGSALIYGVLLLAVGVAIETRRERPLLQLRWLRTRDILRFAAVAVFVRLALAEQTYAAVGLLTSGGLNNDQLHMLFLVVILAMLAGLVCAILTLSERRLPYQVAAAALLIAWGAWLDSGSSNLTRPGQLLFSQALIGFGTTLFIGPALLYGMIRMFAKGADHLVTFVVLFSTTQNFGGLAGSALLGTWQIEATRFHATTLAERALTTDPAVAERIFMGTASLSAALVDPSARAAQGAGLLGRSITREAAVLAFVDIFQVLCAAGLLIAAYVLAVALYKDYRRRNAALGGVAHV